MPQACGAFKTKRITPLETDLDVTDMQGDWPALRQRLRQAIDSGQLRIVVPTMNSETFLDITLSYYAAIGIPVTVLVDSKSSDATAVCARQWADDVRHIDNSSSVVEGMIERLSRQANAQWVLRLDDDELPALGMLAEVARLIELDHVHAVGFVRKQCAVSTDGLLIASQAHRETDHRQWRLYRPDRVQYTQSVHTAGFEPVAKHSFAAPAQAFMTHLDWSLHDYTSRLAKVERYDAHTAGKGAMWRRFYLPEDDPDHDANQFVPVTAPEFEAVCRQIAARFPGNCMTAPDARPRSKSWWSRILGR